MANLFLVSQTKSTPGAQVTAKALVRAYTVWVRRQRIINDQAVFLDVPDFVDLVAKRHELVEADGGPKAFRGIRLSKWGEKL